MAKYSVWYTAVLITYQCYTGDTRVARGCLADLGLAWKGGVNVAISELLSDRFLRVNLPDVL